MKEDLVIDLRSDTFTLPSESMRARFSTAQVGDDYYGEDPSVNRLQEHCKALFQVEDALFVTSGMLANRLAIMSQTYPGEEIITEYNYHLNLFESGATAALAGVVINALNTQDGIIRLSDIQKAIQTKPRQELYTQVTLVSIENTINSRQGKIYPIKEIGLISKFCKEEGIALHMDGARITNAHVATSIPLCEYANLVDTVGICFSKGLGAPFGSMLMGSKKVITKAKRLRTWLGSGFHQVGIYADACHFALTNQLSRLQEDHRLTKVFANKLSSISLLELNPEEVETNMIFFDVSKIGVKAEEFVRRCRAYNLMLCEWLPSVVRVVIHRDITEDKINKAFILISKVIKEFRGL